MLLQTNIRQHKQNYILQTTFTRNTQHKLFVHYNLVDTDRNIELVPRIPFTRDRLQFYTNPKSPVI